MQKVNLIMHPQYWCQDKISNLTWATYHSPTWMLRARQVTLLACCWLFLCSTWLTISTFSLSTSSLKGPEGQTSDLPHKTWGVTIWQRAPPQKQKPGKKSHTERKRNSELGIKRMSGTGPWLWVEYAEKLHVAELCQWKWQQLKSCQGRKQSTTPLWHH